MPELLHTRSYDRLHRVLEIREGRPGPRLIQQGFRERLLCGSCEQHLNRFETYFNNTWFAQVPTRVDVPGRQLQVRVEYAPFKLFHLSVLWRCSVARGSPFRQVSLGQEEDERLRQMLLRDDPGAFNDWGCLAVCLLSPDTLHPCQGLIMPPLPRGAADRSQYETVFGGAVWHYFKHSTGFPVLDDMALTLAGDMTLRVLALERYAPVHRFFLENVTDPEG